MIYIKKFDFKKMLKALFGILSIPFSFISTIEILHIKGIIGDKWIKLLGIDQEAGLYYGLIIAVNKWRIRGLTDPFAWINQIGDALNPAVGGAEVGIRAECYVIKKIGTSICTDVPIFHKAADKLTVNAAPWVVHNLLYF